MDCTPPSGWDNAVSAPVPHPALWSDPQAQHPLELVMTMVWWQTPAQGISTLLLQLREGKMGQRGVGKTHCPFLPLWGLLQPPGLFPTPQGSSLQAKLCTQAVTSRLSRAHMPAALSP